MRNKKLIILCICLLRLVQGHAEMNLDSLCRLIRSDKPDTNKVSHLNDLAWELSNNNPDSALLVAEESLQLSLKLNWKKGTGAAYHRIGLINYLKGNNAEAITAYEKAIRIWDEFIASENDSLRKKGSKAKSASLGNLGIVYYAKGDYPRALEYYHAALGAEELSGDRKRTAGTLGNIGVIYKNQGDYVKALEYYFRSLKIDEEFGNKYGMAARLSNIGVVYSDLGEREKALGYYLKSLAVAKEINNKNSIAGSLGNIGTIYQDKALEYRKKGDPANSDKSFAEALSYFQQYLALAKELDNKYYLVIAMINIGSVHQHKNNFKTAHEYASEALKIARETGDRKNIATCLGALGTISVKLKQYKEAEKYFRETISIADSVGLLEEKMQFENHLSELYELTGDDKNALEHYRAYAAAKDSLFNKEKEKELTRHELNYEFEKKASALKAEQDKREAVAEADKKRQNILFIMISAVAVATALIALIIFRSLRVTRKQKKIIEHQKATVEEKQREVLDSIRYAKRIQGSLLPSEKYISKNLNRLRKQ